MFNNQLFAFRQLLLYNRTHQERKLQRGSRVMSKSVHTETDRAVWLIYVVQSTAEDIGRPVVDTIDLLDKNGLIEWILAGYRSFHTQGFEYMAELLADKLREAQAI